MAATMLVLAIPAAKVMVAPLMVMAAVAAVVAALMNHLFRCQALAAVAAKEETVLLGLLV